MFRELLWLKRQIGRNNKLPKLDHHKTRERIRITLTLITNLKPTHRKNHQRSNQTKRMTFIILEELILTLLKQVTTTSMTPYRKDCPRYAANHQ